MLESLAMNHPFVRRRATSARRLPPPIRFSPLNGYFIDCASRAAYDHFMRLFEASAFRFTELRALARRSRETAAGALIAVRPAEVTLALRCYAHRYGRVWHAICGRLQFVCRLLLIFGADLCQRGGLSVND